MGSEGNGDRVLIGGEDNNWDPLVSLNQSGNFGNHSTLVNLHSPMGCVSSSSSPHLLQFPSDSSLVGIVPNFGSQVFPEMGNSYCPIPESGSSPNFENKCQSPEGGKRKRKVLIGASSKSGEEQHKEDDEKNQSNNGAETYIHVRAKRGQATNSHSLAERVRREKISERMRLLQELVPGCNKITGKALMLDEIINYVQSLQQQVEFLSMKLATVNPELNLDIDKILSKDLLHLRGSNSSALGIVSGPSSAHQPFHGYPFNGAPPFLPLPPQLQHIWNNELQGINQIGFDPDPSACSLGSNGKFASTY